MKYKYIGTDEQLAERGYRFDTADEVWFKDNVIEFDTYDVVDDTVMIDIFDGNKIECLNCERDYIDCTDLIQDLIDLGLVEVVE